MNTAVSVIIPVYNAEDHLKNALDSALSQSLHEIEILCIDDGSTDGSAEILRSARDRDSRVHVIRQENRGAGEARNVGLAKATGEFIAFLDADDFFPRQTSLEKLHALAKEYDVSVAGGSLLFLEDEERKPARIGSIDFTFAREAVMRYSDFQQAYYYQRFIFSREMLMNAGIQFPDYRRFQDVVFFVRAMLEADVFAVTPEPVYVYRKNAGYQTLSDMQINDMLQGYIDVLTIAKGNTFDNLSSFLRDRICKPTKVQEMVFKSIDAGNAIAKERYDIIRGLTTSNRFGWKPLAKLLHDKLLYGNWR